MRGARPAVRLTPVAVDIERLQGDGMLLRSPHRLSAYPAKLTERLRLWAERAPERTLVAQRAESGDGWREVSYRQALASVRSIGQALLDRKLSAERPVVILSDNDIEHALIGLAGQHVGIPTAPLSPAYSLVSSDFAKLKHILALLTPGLVFAADGARFERAIAAALPRDVELVVTRHAPEGRPATLVDELIATPASGAVEAAHERVGPDTIAKFLFTSGSTALPKGVINTQRMLCSNQQMIVETLPFLEDEPPVIVDWLPWNHTFGGNHNFNMMLYNGGSHYIDDGKPLPGAIERTVRNLRDVAPTIYFNVPKGFEELLPYLRSDAALRERFFSRLRMIYYAGAGLSPHVWESLQRLALETIGEEILIGTGLGSTETAPYALVTNWRAERPGIVGLPAPGLELKLIPNGEKLEARVRGPNVTPGYWRQEDLTRAAFDEDGFYKLGDALRFVDPMDPLRGLEFDGRLTEDFKLATGTWVSVGPLRARVIAHCAPLVRDVVIAGHDRDFIGILVFPDADACRALCPELVSDASLVQVLANSAVRQKFQFLLDDLARSSTGSANRVVRLILVEEPPSIDANEITDKGSINQRAVLTRRHTLVADLFAASPSERVLTASLPARSKAG